MLKIAINYYKESVKGREKERVREREERERGRQKEGQKERERERKGWKRVFKRKGLFSRGGGGVLFKGPEVGIFKQGKFP